jgi:hypothetical protein
MSGFKARSGDAILVAGLAIACSAAMAAAADRAPASERPMSLKAGESVTAFGSLTVVGEDRIHVEFQRPELTLDMDPEKAPGLDWGSPGDVLERTAPDPARPFLAASARETSPYLGRPWLEQFASGNVATFRPAVTDVARWTLSIVDSRGEVVASYSGQGQPPREIVWDGRSSKGQVMPGRVYSSAFEAYDRAGNKRNMVGQGFQVGAIRIATATGIEFLFPASDLGESLGRPGAPPSPFLLEAASWIQQRSLRDPVRVTGIARTLDSGKALGDQVARSLCPLLLGGDGRVQVTSAVEADAPPAGTVRISVGASSPGAIRPASGRGTGETRRPGS